MCENDSKKDEVVKLIQKAELAIAKARKQAAELQCFLCDASWIGKYKGDAIVVTTYSDTVRRLRNAALELDNSIRFLKNRLELKNLENLFDDRIIEQLKKLNTNVETQIEKSLTV